MRAELHITPQGECRLGAEPVHPASDPLSAAHSELQPLFSRAQEGDLLILAGAGLGWHAEAARRAAPQLKVLVFEPDAQRRKLLLSKGRLPHEARLAASVAELTALLGALVVYERAGWVSVYSPPAYEKLYPQLAETAKQELDRAITRGQVDRANLRAKKELWLQNLAANFRRIMQLPDLALLGGAMSGIPAVIAGAGPSLDQSLPFLHEAGQKALVMAAASALAPMDSVGLEPHVALALEGLDESRQFAPLNKPSCLLAVSSSSHPNHFSKWKGRLGIYHTLPWLAELIGFGPHLPTGGHVTSAAFSLACLWGCDPIILVGQDLAYSKGRSHAAGRPGGEDYERPRTWQVEAIGGGRIETSAVMQGYITWYREAAAYLLAKPDPPRLINATAEGARLAEFQEVPLDQALAALEPVRQDLEQFFNQLDKLPTPGAAYLASRLARCRAEAAREHSLLIEQGFDTLRKKLKPQSAAGFMLSDLPHDASPETAAGLLSSLRHALGNMGDALHG